MCRGPLAGGMDGSRGPGAYEEEEAGESFVEVSLERYRTALRLSRLALANFLARHSETEDLQRLAEATAFADHLEAGVDACERGEFDFEGLEPLWVDTYDIIIWLDPAEGLTGEVHPHVRLLDCILDEIARADGPVSESGEEEEEQSMTVMPSSPRGRWIAVESMGEFEIGDIMLLKGAEIEVAAKQGTATCCAGGVAVRVELVRDEDVEMRVAQLREAAAAAVAEDYASRQQQQHQGVKERLAARMAATAARRRAAGGLLG